jgi:hypothetical protein
VGAHIKRRSGVLFISIGNSVHVINVTELGVEKRAKTLTLRQLFSTYFEGRSFSFSGQKSTHFCLRAYTLRTYTYTCTHTSTKHKYVYNYIHVHIHTYFSLYNRIVMMLREIVVTQCPPRALHGLVPGSTNFAGR